MNNDEKPSGISLEEQLRQWEAARESAKNRRRTWKRSTLTARSAEQMLPWINQLLKAPGAVLVIPYSAFPGNSPHTIYMKWKDSLIWFLQCDVGVSPEQKRAVAWVKAACKVARGENELQIVPPNINAKACGIVVTSVNNSHVAKQAEAIVRDAQLANEGWKQDFVDFIQSGADGDTFHRRGVFSPDDLAWVRGITQGEGFAVKLEVSEIKVTKI